MKLNLIQYNTPIGMKNVFIYIFFFFFKVRQLNKYFPFQIPSLLIKAGVRKMTTLALLKHDLKQIKYSLTKQHYDLKIFHNFRDNLKKYGFPFMLGSILWAAGLFSLDRIFKIRSQQNQILNEKKTSVHHHLTTGNIDKIMKR